MGGAEKKTDGKFAKRRRRRHVFGRLPSSGTSPQKKET